MRAFAAAAFFAVLAQTPVSAAEATAVVFVVRHAEKLAPEVPDSELSEAGRARAALLAERLRDRGIRSILVSEKRRTRQTAAPLAQRLALEPAVVPSATQAADPRAFARAIAERRELGAVLVVTHSDAIPGLICELSGRAVPEVEEEEYDRLYTIDGRELRFDSYGAPFSGARKTEATRCAKPEKGEARDERVSAVVKPRTRARLLVSIQPPRLATPCRLRGPGGLASCWMSFAMTS